MKLTFLLALTLLSACSGGVVALTSPKGMICIGEKNSPSLYKCLDGREVECDRLWRTLGQEKDEDGIKGTYQKGSTKILVYCTGRLYK